jgi:hypothetical protein
MVDRRPGGAAQRQRLQAGGGAHDGVTPDPGDGHLRGSRRTDLEGGRHDQLGDIGRQQLVGRG